MQKCTAFHSVLDVRSPCHSGGEGGHTRFVTCVLPEGKALTENLENDPRQRHQPRRDPERYRAGTDAADILKDSASPV